MCALLAVLLDAMTRMLISDTGEKYMPKFLRKTNKDGLPINGYLLTCGLSAFIMLLGVFLHEMNDIFNWLLNLERHHLAGRYLLDLLCFHADS